MSSSNMTANNLWRNRHLTIRHRRRNLNVRETAAFSDLGRSACINTQLTPSANRHTCDDVSNVRSRLIRQQCGIRPCQSYTRIGHRQTAWF